MNEIEQVELNPDTRNLINHSARRINRISKAIGAQTYLEIGVNKGGTFLSVDTPIKTAVDPKFRFDTSVISNADIYLHEVPSDAFFAALPVQQKYDLIFIDGLHTFEQTYRDLCNCLNHSHERTVILIDDVQPNDVFASLRNQSQAVSFRRHSGTPGAASWMGDVFKVVFMLHDFHLGLNYCTLQTNQKRQQTLVWRSNANWRKPLFNSFELIDRLSYFDLISHIEILKTCPEEEGIQLCLNELVN